MQQPGSLLILSNQQVSALARGYDTLAYLPGLASLLSGFVTDQDFSRYPKRKLHECVNDILMEYHPGETGFKYHLFRRAARQNLVAAFEIRVLNSRMDFLTVNGTSHGYEIKSALDNLEKLPRQAADYQLSFDFNTVVVDKRHKDKALAMLPVSFGVIGLGSGKQRKIYRRATRNTAIDPRIQLSLLTKKEIKTVFGITESDSILATYTDTQVNNLFKKALKDRYRNRWNFMVKHSESILPVDLQFFFNRNIEPSLIYQHA